MSDNIRLVSDSLTTIVVALITAGKVDEKNVAPVIAKVKSALNGELISETVPTPSNDNAVSVPKPAPTRAPVTESDIIRSLAQKAVAKIPDTAAVVQEDQPPYQRDGKTPAVDPAKSVSDNGIICLDDGKSFKTLKRHVAQLGYETPEAYLAYWGLPADYPFVAPSYSERRSNMAKSFGFGTKGNTGSKGKKTPKAKPNTVKVQRPDWIGADEDIVEATVKDDYIICLLDKAEVKYIRGYVRNPKRFNMKWEDYLTMFGLPDDYPHTPYAYARRQQQDAQAHGVEVRQVEVA
jgi:predicted transcriptional regulator